MENEAERGTDMIYDRMEFYNVEAIVKEERGCKMSRLPRDVAQQLDYGIRDGTSFLATGVELRFRMTGDEVKLHLRVSPEEEAQMVLIYFGAIQGGWQYASKTLGTTETVISIKYPENLEILETISEREKLSFHPRMVRVLLPYGTCFYLGKEGDTEPPLASDSPQKRYLAYGSSITHGSMALLPPHTYPSRIAESFGMDCINQGYAGSAFMEKPMAEYIAARKDWTLASVEMGINMLNKPLRDEDYEKRIKEFLGVLAKDGRTVFVTDIFNHNGEKQERTAIFRDIVRRHAHGGGLIYTPGEYLLSNPAYVSADLTHPTVKGMEQIARRWSEVMRAYGTGIWEESGQQESEQQARRHGTFHKCGLQETEITER